MTSPLTQPAPASCQLTIVSRREEGQVMLALHGEIDLATAPDLAAELERVEALGPDRITIDLTHLDFIDSTGLHVLLAANQRAHETGRRLVITNIPRSARRLLDITGLDAQFVLI